MESVLVRCAIDQASSRVLALTAAIGLRIRLVFALRGPRTVPLNFVRALWICTRLRADDGDLERTASLADRDEVDLASCTFRTELNRALRFEKERIEIDHGLGLRGAPLSLRQVRRSLSTAGTTVLHPGANLQNSDE